MPPVCIAVDNLVALSATCTTPKNWSTWADSTDPTPEPDQEPNKTSSIPPMLRRRLTPLGRLALEALARISPKSDEMIIFASNWGDVDRSRAWIIQMNEEIDISPMGFASSVHNAIGAVASIWLKNTSPYKAICADVFTTEAAFIEAYSQLIAGEKSIIIVRYDSPLPDIWASGSQQTIHWPYAWACRVRLPHDQAGQNLRLRTTDESGKVQDELQELRFLLSNTKLFKHTDVAGGWIWDRI